MCTRVMLDKPISAAKKGLGFIQKILGPKEKPPVSARLTSQSQQKAQPEVTNAAAIINRGS